MPQSQLPFPFASFPVFNPMTFWQGFATVARAMEPAVRTATNANLEVMGLIGSRTRAALEFSHSLSRCRTPQDVIAVQTRFLETAREDFVATGQRVGTAWQGVLAPMTAAMVNSAAQSRDYMSLAEPQKAEQSRSEAGPTYRGTDESRRAA